MNLKGVSVEKAIEKKYPEPIILVTSVDKNGRANIIVLAWYMQTSFQPRLFAISIGKTRYSHKLISESKEFVLVFPSQKMKEQTLFCGTHSGKSIDKFKETGLIAVSSKKVKAPLIDGCLANFECKVVNSVDSGDHTIFVGEVLAAYASIDESLKRLYADIDRKMVTF